MTTLKRCVAAAGGHGNLITRELTMIAPEETDERARQMSDGERDAYLTARDWEFIGVGWFPPSEAADSKMGGRMQFRPSGVYSMSTAIREQLAREDPDSVPDEHGRYYHGTEPADFLGRRW